MGPKGTTYLIVGVVCGAVILIILLTLFIYYVVKYCKRNKNG